MGWVVILVHMVGVGVEPVVILVLLVMIAWVMVSARLRSRVALCCK